jgi:hypothetical protein
LPFLAGWVPEDQSVNGTLKNKMNGAYPNGACVCLSKPVSLAELTNAIAALQPIAPQLAVA